MMPANRDPKEAELVARLRGGDESAFAALVDAYHAMMIRFALGFVRDRATAEEVVQDAWVGVLQGLASFEGRSSLRSWIFTIVANRAKTRGIREARSTPFSALAAQEASGTEPAVDPVRFRPAGTEWPGHWATPPQPWGGDPEARLLRAETMTQIERTLESLPRAARGRHAARRRRPLLQIGLQHFRHHRDKHACPPASRPVENPGRTRAVFL